MGRKVVFKERDKNNTLTPLYKLLVKVDWISHTIPDGVHTPFSKNSWYAMVASSVVFYLNCGIKVSSKFYILASTSSGPSGLCTCYYRGLELAISERVQLNMSTVSTCDIVSVHQKSCKSIITSIFYSFSH